MISQRALGIRSLALFWQLVIVTLCYWGWLFIWQPTLFGEHETLQRYLLYNEFLLIGVLFGWGRRSETNGLHHEWVWANRQTMRQAFLGLFGVFVILFALKDMVVSRSFLVSYVPWLYLSLLFSNYLLPRSLGKWAFSGDREERVALAGTVQQATLLRPWLEKKNLVGLRTIGLICPELSVGGPAPFPVLGTTDRMGEILREWSITQVILMDLSGGAKWVQGVTQLCEGAAVRLLALYDLNEYFNHSTTTFEDDGVRFIGLREEPLESPLNRFVKRVMDLVIAVPFVVFILPAVTVLVWLMQKLQSPGPIFYRQERTGMMGRPFMMFKYRTMCTNHNNHAKQASKNDPRVFPAGRWMRKFSIDELPQFLNVVLGHMSVVGPRPHLREHEETFVLAMRRYVIRKFIRPGMTGWAQVSGFRGEIHHEQDIHQRVEADIYYLEHWSFSLDCLIMLKTVKQCLAPPGSAY